MGCSRMCRKMRFLIFLLVLLVNFSLVAQTHLSVPLGHPVYHVLEQAQMRGLLRHLPNVRPFSRAQVLSFITEILGSDTERLGALNDNERNILQQFRQDLTLDIGGLDLVRGTISGERTTANDMYFSWQLGFGSDLQFGIGFFPIARGFTQPAGANETHPFFRANHPDSGDIFYSVDMEAANISFSGDIGSNMSYNLSISGMVLRHPRSVLGTYNSLFLQSPNDPHEVHRTITTFSEPHAAFPFSQRRRWDNSVWGIGDVNNAGHLAWPNGFSIGYRMMPEFAASLFRGHGSFRFARIEREWASMTTGGSLVLNEAAQPFMGFEITVSPFDWFSFSSLTGVLEFHNSVGLGGRGGNTASIKAAASTFQNAYSLVMAEFDWRYFHLGLGSSVVWPRRFELAYLFPLSDNFLYQNNIGDFDNMALFLNLQGRLPGRGNAWFSFFLDEMDFAMPFFQKSRMMYAFQFGASTHLPIRRLPFSTITVSYTKIEPFNYTHNRVQVPWYGDAWMEVNTVNFGRALGSYLPPNSDEFLVRFETLPTPQSRVRLQYQLIRHGANYGDRAVVGSSLWSEMDPRSSVRHSLRKHFLRDGAYQWMNIFRVRGEYSFTGSNLPFRVFAEVGGVYSFFTDIDSNIAPNSGRHSFRIVDTPEYPTTLRFIATVGVQIFPKF